MSAHQRYLEAPYEQAEREYYAFEQWCEENERDMDDPKARDDYEEEMTDRAEQAAEERAEALAEDRFYGYDAD